MNLNKNLTSERPELHPLPVKSPWYHLGMDFVGAKEGNHSAAQQSLWKTLTPLPSAVCNGSYYLYLATFPLQKYLAFVDCDSRGPFSHSTFSVFRQPVLVLTMHRILNGKIQDCILLLLFRDDGFLRRDDGFLRRDDGFLRRDDDVLLRDDGVLLRDDSFRD
jgi:hypothetical protein